MLSFKSLAFAAAVAFGALSTAFAAPAVVGSEVVARDLVAARGVAVILTDVHTKIQPHILELNSLVKANATVEVVTPIVVEIKGVVVDAVVEVIALAGASADVILAGVDGGVQVTVAVLAQIIADLLILVFGALGFVLSICADVTVMIPCLCIVADVIGCLICAVFSLVGSLLVGIIGAVVVLIAAILPVIAQLNILVLVNVFAGVKL
ncbi:hypothetical protein EIP91_000769 [Steccherinum ochraceum]|uniref:Transmembrane protein n=1 Tax=Steccherinum ochraceum TaxID=92696 RepID=A0A4R0RFA0_9APHY|nr:hypothetical protein EIP91_000769 [Steccherinum ochraceum]